LPKWLNAVIPAGSRAHGIAAEIAGSSPTVTLGSGDDSHHFQLLMWMPVCNNDAKNVAESNTSNAFHAALDSRHPSDN
jgi:hypothetical protein